MLVFKHFLQLCHELLKLCLVVSPCYSLVDFPPLGGLALWSLPGFILAFGLLGISWSYPGACDLQGLSNFL